MTAPVDMIKTRLMLQRESETMGRYKNGFHCAYQVAYLSLSLSKPPLPRNQEYDFVTERIAGSLLEETFQNFHSISFWEWKCWWKVWSNLQDSFHWNTQNAVSLLLLNEWKEKINRFLYLFFSFSMENMAYEERDKAFWIRCSLVDSLSLLLVLFTLRKNFAEEVATGWQSTLSEEEMMVSLSLSDAEFNIKNGSFLWTLFFTGKKFRGPYVDFIV